MVKHCKEGKQNFRFRNNLSFPTNQPTNQPTTQVMPLASDFSCREIEIEINKHE